MGWDGKKDFLEVRDRKVEFLGDIFLRLEILNFGIDGCLEWMFEGWGWGVEGC